MKLIFKVMYAAYYITVHSWQVFKFKKTKMAARYSEQIYRRA